MRWFQQKLLLGMEGAIGVLNTFVGFPPFMFRWLRFGGKMSQEEPKSLTPTPKIVMDQFSAQFFKGLLFRQSYDRKAIAA